MKDYSKGKIYKIVGNGFTYYGSTCEPTLARRLAKHRSYYKNYLIGKYHYVTSFKCFENDNKDYFIVLVENYPCKSNDELLKRERFYIEKNKCVNKIIPSRTVKEYSKGYFQRPDVKEKERLRGKSQYRKQYREKKQKESVHICLCGGVSSVYSKARHERTIKHTQFMNRFNSKDMEISFSAIKELHERRHKN